MDYRGKIRSCRVHDLMCEIILRKAEELSFCRSFGEEDSSFDGKFRCGSVQKSTDNVVEAINRNPQIRSILLFDIDAVPMLFTGTSLTNFNLLKILDFEKAPLYSVPEDLGNLFHLRYLSLSRTKVKMLPKSIGKLQNLQTLDLKHSLVDALPVEIKKLRKLRHILAYAYKVCPEWDFYTTRGIHIGEGIGSMLDLQKLCYVEANHGMGLIEELGKLRQLRRLGITNLVEDDGLRLCASISNMKHLESLCICSKDDDILKLETISVPPRYLRNLYLQGCLSKLPEWLPTLRSLVRVCLRRSGLSYDPVEVLQALPNLLEVELHTAYDGECLCFSELGFQKLERLQLRDMKGLKTLKIRDGALPLLKHFEIGPSPQLEEVPPGIRLLKTLTSIEFWGMSDKFLLSMLPEHGENYQIVEHVPNVFFHFSYGGGYHTMRL